MIILQEGTVDHDRYIREVLPVAIEYGNKILRSDWTFQQDSAKPHVYYLTQQWSRNNFPLFIDKDEWLPNSSDLNPLDYAIWDELAQVINWDRVTSKTTLIEQLKRAVKKIRQEVVFESCSSCTNTFYRVSENDGGYLR